MAKPFLTRADEGFWAVVQGDVRIEVPSFGEATGLLREATALGDLELAAYGDGGYEGPSCSICDALGHGYPGGGPCPLEETGYWDAEEDRRRFGGF